MINVEVLSLGPMDNCTYLVSKGNQSLLIDPAWDMNEIEQTLTEKNLNLLGVLFTHGHFDHVKLAHTLLEKHHLKAYLEERDVPLSDLPLNVLHTYQGDQTFNIGPFDIHILATPGHTAGSVCIQIGNFLFTGDTLFPGACGRVDLPSSDPRKMLESLKRIASLPEETILYAGHSYGGRCRSSVREEKQTNPFVRNALRGEE